LSLLHAALNTPTSIVLPKTAPIDTTALAFIVNASKDGNSSLGQAMSPCPVGDHGNRKVPAYQGMSRSKSHH
jgi:hypothetical protein